MVSRRLPLSGWCRPRSEGTASAGAARTQTDHTIAVPDQRGGLDPHPQIEVRFGFPGLREQVEEVPLGCDRHERVGQVEAGEVGEEDIVAVSSGECHAFDAAVSDAGELAVESELVEQPQG